ncbi:MAG: RNA polymerase sigma factor, partial [Patescibacteria group bacterium]
MPVKIDQQSFLQAYDELADALFRHCFFRLYDREKARDAVQEVFLRAWDYMSSGGEVKNIKAFLFQTARNYIIDEHRKALLRRHPSLDEIKETGQEPGHDPRLQLDARVDASRLLDLCA